VDSLKKLESVLGIDLKVFPQVKTPGGGRHIYIKVGTGGLRLKHTLPEFPGIEFKSVGRQVVAPGSIHPNRGRYEWDLSGHLKSGHVWPLQNRPYETTFRDKVFYSFSRY
jgi:hypothetical protein